MARIPPAAPVATAIDPVIDYVVEVNILVRDRRIADLHEELLALAAGWGKPVQVAGYDPASGEWQRDRNRQRQTFFAIALCPADDEPCRLRDAKPVGGVSRCCHCIGPRRNQGEAKCLDVAEAHAMAAQLDRFCAEVDIAIGINVVTRDGNPFSGTKIRALAEAAGLKLEPDWRVLCAQRRTAICCSRSTITNRCRSCRSR